MKLETSLKHSTGTKDHRENCRTKLISTFRALKHRNYRFFFQSDHFPFRNRLNSFRFAASIVQTRSETPYYRSSNDQRRTGFQGKFSRYNQQHRERKTAYAIKFD